VDADFTLFKHWCILFESLYTYILHTFVLHCPDIVLDGVKEERNILHKIKQ
jgi:hypothetical protein